MEVGEMDEAGEGEDMEEETMCSPKCCSVW
jgi:hypothetical protein